MSVSVSQSVSAMARGLSTYFLGQGGVEPYMYSVLPNGAGGTIDPDTGFYTAPIADMGVDTIQVQDSNGDMATGTVLITDALGLFCDIIQKEMGLANGRVYLWDQKIEQPKDNDLYIAIGVQSAEPFGNTTRPNGDGSGLVADQSVNMLATLSIDLISRGPAARNRKEEVILALNSIYSQMQQEANSFYVGKLSTSFVNLSNVDGAAIPYRFTISVNIQYFVRVIKAVPYFDEFSDVDVTTEP